MNPIQLRGLDHIVLRVRRLDAALAFYCGVLGCREERSVPALGLYQLRAGDALIDLVPVDGPLGRAGGAPPAAEARNVDHFALELDAFDAAAIAAHLRAHGIEAGEVAERYGARGSGPSIYIRDPDGNVVELKGSTRPSTPTRSAR
jgi:catechol 2,3-dioxygenase-like lactoylglutathione lyase family enzyme